MDWEGSSPPPSSSPSVSSPQRASPQRSPSLFSSSSVAMLPPPPATSAAAVVGVGARVSSPPSLSLQTSQHSQSHSYSYTSIKHPISSQNNNNNKDDVAAATTSSKATTTATAILSPSSSPLELTGPRSKHQQLVVGSSTSPTRSLSVAHTTYSTLSGPKNPVVLISSTTSSLSPSASSSLLSSSPTTKVTEAAAAASLNSWKSSSSSVAGRLQLDHHHHHHRAQQQFHSQTYRNPSNSTTTSSTTIYSGDEGDSCGAVDLVASNKTTSSRIQDQPEELVLVASIAGQQKHHQHNLGVPSSLSSSSSSSPSPFVSTFQEPLLLRRTSRDEEVAAEDKEEAEQKHPHDLSNPSKTTCQQHQKNQQHSGGEQQHQQKQSSHHKLQPLTIKRHKPIPPPLDLSIGAANSLHHPHSQHNIVSGGSSNTGNNANSSSSSNNNSGSSTNHNHSYSISNNNAANNTNHQQNHNPQHPTSPIYLGSPKFADNKSLPIRKRYQQWSPPTQMNGQEHAEAAVVAAAATSSAAVTPSSSGPGSAGIFNNRTWGVDMVPLSAPPITSSARNNNHHHHGISLASSNNANTNTNNNNINSTSSIPNSLGLHTPTPFFTPNEPSPKFMNSPVFSYSNPDTTLYQGPFSPIRASSLYPPPSSPFTNLSLNSPLPPLQNSVSSNSSSISSNSSTSSSHSSSNGGGSGGGTPASAGGGGMVGNPCFNMIPSTLLSPAPSQASTNSLSYEDLHEKSLSLISPVWSIFMAGTKVRFVGGMNSMDWYLADVLAQSDDSLLGLKGEYAPHGLELRKLVMTSSPKERVQLTFCPVADTNHPTIEVNCEPGHPFWVDKKGWCAVKPEVFQETYGTSCQALEGGDICLSLNATRSPNNNIISINNNNSPNFIQQQHQQQSLMHHNHNAGFSNPMMHHGINVSSSGANTILNNNAIITSSGVALTNMHNINHLHHVGAANNVNNNGLINQPMTSIMSSANASVMKLDVKMDNNDIKPFPISVHPQNQHGGMPMQLMQSPPPPPIQHQSQNHHPHQRGSGNGNSRKTSYASVPMSAPGSPAKRAKDGSQTGEQPTKGRRPMNAFLLFAKDKRPELIQKYPGKDNRTISVLLGEAWQKLAAPERERYASNAKARAEEQKRIHPDCWKRKRSQSTSS